MTHNGILIHKSLSQQATTKFFYSAHTIYIQTAFNKSNNNIHVRIWCEKWKGEMYETTRKRRRIVRGTTQKHWRESARVRLRCQNRPICIFIALVFIIKSVFFSLPAHKQIQFVIPIDAVPCSAVRIQCSIIVKMHYLTLKIHVHLS